ncbi:MAG TPA: threonine/serine dehydratase [Candidatus Solibacter sp.]
MKERILAAYERIRGVVRETPLERASGCEAWLKLEHLQHTGSFKFRGAANKIGLLTGEQEVVTASNGNHGLGVAAAAEARGIAAEVFVSSHVSRAKAARIQARGARIRFAGDDPLTAEVTARRAAEETGRVYISPYNDLDVAAGQGTIAVELLRQAPDLDAVFVAVGGGGLIGGIGSYLNAVSPRTEVVGCWPENSPVMKACLDAGKIVDVAELPTLSESTAGGLEEGSVTFELCRNAIDRSVLVTEEEILRAMRFVLQTEHWVIEGAAGVAMAAYLKDAERYRGKKAAVVICGRNVSEAVLEKLC